MNFIYINLLPDDIIELIWNNYINPINKVFTNKNNYKQYHSIIFSYLYNYENYIRDVIRLDNIFVFKNILNEQINNWIVKKKIIKYQNLIFSNYINYINFLINKYNSGKIKYELLNNLKQLNSEKSWQQNYIQYKQKWNGI